MPSKQPPPLIAQEYGPPITVRAAAAHFALSTEVFDKLLQTAVSNARPLFPSLNFLEYHAGNAFRFVDVAGILNLTSHLRIEIVPKFLNASNPHWREDFLRIAALTRHGQLFSHTLIPTARRGGIDLFEIIAQTWLNLFETNSRALPRTYINSKWEAFALDGEAEEEDLLLPTPEGISQAGLVLSRANSYTKKLLEAASHIRTRVTYPRSVMRLDRAISTLLQSLREPHSRHHKPLNTARAVRWQAILQLSDLIISQTALGFSGEGPTFLPGYLLRTPSVWEALARLSFKKAFPDYTASKPAYRFATRTDNAGRSRPLDVTPDITVRDEENIKFLGDAKYKLTKDSGDKASFSTIAAADIYESVAFMSAAKCKVLLLIYPDPRPVESDPTAGQPLEVVRVGLLTIVAASLGVTGISQTKGVNLLSRNLKALTTHCLTVVSADAASKTE